MEGIREGDSPADPEKDGSNDTAKRKQLTVHQNGKNVGRKKGPDTFHHQLAQNGNKGGGRKKRGTAGEVETKEDTH
jgi:hypothetical protein